MSDDAAALFDELRMLDSADFNALQAAHMRPVTGAIPTPLPLWNRSCRDDGGGIGLAPGWFVLIAGKPGAGKSLAAINLMASAMRHGTRVACLSFEMSTSQLATRMLAVVSGCDVRRLEQGASFSRETWAEAVQEWHAVLRGKLFLCERPRRSLAATAALLRYAAEESHTGCKLVVVDYVQLLGRREHANIFERTQAVSGMLQEFAFEHNVTVVALSQFNRTTLSARNEVPGPEGLKGGSLDEDADQVVMLDYSNFARTDTGARTKAVIGKNRHGPTPEIPIMWNFDNLTMREITSLDQAQEHIRQASGLAPRVTAP